jgi:hypothetical protein
MVDSACLPAIVAARLRSARERCCTLRATGGWQVRRGARRTRHKRSLPSAPPRASRSGASPCQRRDVAWGKFHEHVAEACPLRPPYPPVGPSPLVNPPLSAAPALTATPIHDHGYARDVAHYRREMSKGGRIAGRYDEQPSCRRKGRRGKHLQQTLLMPITDAVCLASVFQRLADPEKVRATFVLTPCTHYSHRHPTYAALGTRPSRLSSGHANRAVCDQTASSEPVRSTRWPPS